MGAVVALCCRTFEGCGSGRHTLAQILLGGLGRSGRSSRHAPAEAVACLAVYRHKNLAHCWELGVQHILVLEHYPPTRQALVLALRRAGWEVEQAATARDALLALARTPYDAVLVDLDTSTGDGWQVLEALHASHTPAAIVALLGSESSGHRHAQTLGVRVILPKPVGKELLLAGMRAALEAPKVPKGCGPC